MSTWAEVQEQINNLLTLAYDGANDIQRFRQAFSLIINQINAGSSDPENDSLWDPEISYPADVLPAFWRDEWVVSNIADNLGIEPIDSGGVVAPEWRIASASNGSGIAVWSAKIFPNTLEVVFYNNKLLFLDRTVVGADPFSSTDIDAEIIAGQWKSFFGDYYRGEFASLAALQSAIPSGSPGDYANVDTGPGNDVQRYIWDEDDDDWVLGGYTDAQLIAKIDTATGGTTWRTFDPTTKLDKTANLSDVSNPDTALGNLLENATDSVTHSVDGDPRVIDYDGIRHFTLTMDDNIGALSFTNLPVNAKDVDITLTIINDGYSIDSWTGLANPDDIDPDYLLTGTTDVLIRVRPDSTYIAIGYPRP